MAEGGRGARDKNRPGAWLATFPDPQRRLLVGLMTAQLQRNIDIADSYSQKKAKNALAYAIAVAVCKALSDHGCAVLLATLLHGTPWMVQDGETGDGVPIVLEPRSLAESAEEARKQVRY